MAVNSESRVSDALDDTDQIWGMDDEVTIREWAKMDDDFTNAGYREGITAGKESALQKGFDDGFDNTGAPLGREIGILRGIAHAVMSLFSPNRSRRRSSPQDDERLREEIGSISRDLGRIHLADLAPRDLQAVEHAKEHLEGNVSEATHPKVNHQTVNGGLPSQSAQHQLNSFNDVSSPPGVEELQRLRLRLLDVVKELGLDISWE